MELKEEELDIDFNGHVQQIGNGLGYSDKVTSFCLYNY